MARFSIALLGSSKQNCDWHIFMVSILFVRKSFIKIYLSHSQKILFTSSLYIRLYSQRNIMIAHNERTNQRTKKQQWFYFGCLVHKPALYQSTLTVDTHFLYKTHIQFIDSDTLTEILLTFFCFPNAVLCKVCLLPTHS